MSVGHNTTNSINVSCNHPTIKKTLQELVCMFVCMRKQWSSEFWYFTKSQQAIKDIPLKNLCCIFPLIAYKWVWLITNVIHPTILV